MKNLRKLDFVELTRSELRNVIGGTDPNPYSTTEDTVFVGDTYSGNGQKSPDNDTDTKTTTDHQSDYA